MARPIYKYQPINETPDVAIGLLLPFNKSSKAKSVSANYASGSSAGASVFAQSYTTIDQSVSNLKNFLMTRKGERIMQPNFGSNIYSLLFENNTADIKTSIKTSLTKDLNYWLPYITINDVKILSNTALNTITIGINFQITNIGANLVINVIASENSLIVEEGPVDTSLQVTNY
tara:strand:- start:11258 stop:11779 length:522 start_codon:yes stop_codon:yes gene_type:complete